LSDGERIHKLGTSRLAALKSLRIEL
jgi:hypothetical protein